MVVSGGYIDFDYISPFIHCHWKIFDEFFPATSNVYSLDRVINGALSTTFVGGVPAPGISDIKFHPMLTQAGWRIRLLASLSPDETQFADLPLMGSGYWNVIPTP